MPLSEARTAAGFGTEGWCEMTHAVPRSLAAQRRLDWRGKGQNQTAVLQEGGADSLDNVLAAEKLPLSSDLICISLSPTTCHHVYLECCRTSGICLLMCKGPFFLPSAQLVLRCFTSTPGFSTNFLLLPLLCPWYPYSSLLPACRGWCFYIPRHLFFLICYRS